MTFRELMKEKGFNQTRLSLQADVSQSNLSIYCNKREKLEASSLVTRMKIAKAFEMTLEEFEEILCLEPAKIIASNKQQGNYMIIEV